MLLISATMSGQGADLLLPTPASKTSAAPSKKNDEGSGITANVPPKYWGMLFPKALWTPRFSPVLPKLPISSMPGVISQPDGTGENLQRLCGTWAATWNLVFASNSTGVASPT